MPGGESGALRLAGGGSLHLAWHQMLADILDRELLTVGAPAASARGAALLGGIWADVETTGALAPSTRLVAAPDPQRVAAYEQAYAHYLALSLMQQQRGSAADPAESPK